MLLNDKQTHLKVIVPVAYAFRLKAKWISLTRIHDIFVRLPSVTSTPAELKVLNACPKSSNVTFQTDLRPEALLELLSTPQVSGTRRNVSRCNSERGCPVGRGIRSESFFIK